MLCNFYFDPILRNLQGDTHKEHKFDMILKCHILNSFNMKCVTTDRLKGLFIYGAQKFFGYELKNFLAKDEKFFGY